MLDWILGLGAFGGLAMWMLGGSAILKMLATAFEVVSPILKEFAQFVVDTIFGFLRSCGRGLVIVYQNIDVLSVLFVVAIGSSIATHIYANSVKDDYRKEYEKSSMYDRSNDENGIISSTKLKLKNLFKVAPTSKSNGSGVPNPFNIPGLN